MQFVLAFAVGGALCAVAQLVVDLGHLTPAHTLVLFVALGAVASAFGLYQPLIDLAGAGATIPLPGFGHGLVEGIEEAVRRDGALGFLAGGLEAVALGVTVALLSGLLAAALFNPKE